MSEMPRAGLGSPSSTNASKNFESNFNTNINTNIKTNIKTNINTNINANLNTNLNTNINASYGTQQAAMQAYLTDGEVRGLALDNRGPITFNQDGSLHRSILDAYEKYGFYIFTGVLNDEELSDIEADVKEILQRAPVLC